jgi:hypothetical protein
MRNALIQAGLTGTLLMLAACTQQAPPSGSAALLSGAAAASASAPAPPDSGHRVAAPAAAAPGVRVFIDPVTGEAREPTRAEVAAGAAGGRVQRQAVAGQAASESVQREHFVLPDGTEGVKLLPRDQHAVVVCRQADGSFGSHCPRANGAAAP